MPERVHRPGLLLFDDGGHSASSAMSASMSAALLAAAEKPTSGVHGGICDSLRAACGREKTLATPNRAELESDFL